MSDDNKKDPASGSAAEDSTSERAGDRTAVNDGVVTREPTQPSQPAGHTGGSVPTAVPQPESEAASVTADEPPAGVPAAKEGSGAAASAVPDSIGETPAATGGDAGKAPAASGGGAAPDAAAKSAGEAGDAPAAANGAGAPATGDAPVDAEREAKLKAAAEARAARAAAKAAAEGGAGAPATGDAPVDPEREAKQKAAAEARAARAAAKAAAEGGAAEAPAEPKPPSPNQPRLDEAAALLRELVHGDAVEEAYINEMNRDLPTLVIKSEYLRESAELLKNHDKLRQNYLRNVSGVDHETHMEVVYHMVDLESRREFAVKVKTDREAPSVPSLTPVWPTANWNEREIYDLLGIDFPGHPDLRRIMMPDDWAGHPLRKDYEPLDPEV